MGTHSILLIVTLFLQGWLSHQSPINAKSTLKIGAFNIQVFGQSKMGKPDVVAVLKDVSKIIILILLED